jgi:hypothetical protein
MDALAAVVDGQVDLDYGNTKAVILTHAFAAPGQKAARDGTREFNFYGQGKRA